MHAAKWGPITAIIGQLEALLSHFAVPTAYVDGRAVLEVSHQCQCVLELLQLLLPMSLLSCFCLEHSVELRRNNFPLLFSYPTLPFPSWRKTIWTNPPLTTFWVAS